jgi:hypothetical protein
VLQPDFLKLESCKFNIIINIINITLGSSVAAKPKALGHIFAERPNTLRSYPFLIFFMQEKKFNPWCVPLFFFSLFLFKPFTVDCTVQSTVKKLMPLVFFLINFFKI